MANGMFIYGKDGKLAQVDNDGALLVKIIGSSDGGGLGGMQFHFGNSAPDNSLGNNGDVFLNTTNGDFYHKAEDAWNLKGNLLGPKGDKGDTGEQGPQGIKGDTGSQGPAGNDGVGITDITSDDVNITFHLSDGTTKSLPWPSQTQA